MTGYTMRRASRLLCCAIAALAAASGPAVAANEDDILIEGDGQSIAVRSILVATADLDLATARGNRVLDERIARAARQACGESYVDDLQAVGDYISCRDQTLAEARREIERMVTVRNAARADAIVQTASR